MLIDEYKRYLVTGMIESLLAEQTSERKLAILRRVMSALTGTDRITKKLYPTSKNKGS